MNQGNCCGSRGCSTDGHWAGEQEEPCYKLTPELIKTWYEFNANTNAFTDAEKSALNKMLAGNTGINAMTDSQIKLAYERNKNTNGLTNAEKTLITNLMLTGVPVNVYSKIAIGQFLANKVDKVLDMGLSHNDFTDAYRTKLDGLNISGGSQTDAQIKSAYERNPDTNSFTDAEKIKLIAIEGSHFKGLFSTIGDLQTANPTSEAGGYAYLKNGIDDEQLVMWDGTAWEVLASGGIAAPVLTAAQIKVLYEGNANTNGLSDNNLAKITSALQPVDIDNKVDKVIGQGLSSNNYTNGDKILVSTALQSVDIAGKVDKVAGMTLTSNDYTDAEKLKLAGLEGSHFKGSHPDEAALLAAHPTAEPGSYAYVIVHNNDHNFIWDDTNSAWVDTGATGAVHLTDAQIKTQYENNPDTNVFNDTSVTDLNKAVHRFAGVHTDLATLETLVPAASAVLGSYAYINDGVNPQTVATLSGGVWVEGDSSGQLVHRTLTSKGFTVRKDDYNGDLESGEGAINFSWNEEPPGSQDDFGAVGKYAFATGFNTTAYGDYSFVAGADCYVTGTQAFAHGKGCEAQGSQSHAEGHYSKALGNDAHAENHHALVDAGTHASHAEGFGCTISGDIDKAGKCDENPAGLRVIPEGGGGSGFPDFDPAIAYPTGTQITNDNAEWTAKIDIPAGEPKPLQDRHGDWQLDTVLAPVYQIEGGHAEGYKTIAQGKGAHSEGVGTVAEGTGCHAQGIGTISRGQGVCVVGKFNNPNAENIFEVGVGYDDTNRKTAVAVDRHDGILHTTHTYPMHEIDGYTHGEPFITRHYMRNKLLELPAHLSGATDPANTLGNDGDIYFKVV